MTSAYESQQAASTIRAMYLAEKLPEKNQVAVAYIIKCQYIRMQQIGD